MLKRIVFLLVSCFIAGCGAPGVNAVTQNGTKSSFRATANPFSVIRESPDRSRRWLEIGSSESNRLPFLVLSLQPDLWALEIRDTFAEYQFKWAKELGANTIQVQVPWAAVEPAEGRYTMDYVRWVMDQARGNNLKLILEWFGSNVVGKSSGDGKAGGYPEEVPMWVLKNPSRFPRINRKSKAIPQNPLDPANLKTRNAETAAFRKVVQFVKAEDRDGLVIAWQIANEVGILDGQPMPYSPRQLLDHLIAYVSSLAKIQKEEQGLPAYMNFWEGILRGEDPFEFLRQIPEIDFIGPDEYGGNPLFFRYNQSNYQSFIDRVLRQLDRYNTDRNLVFIPETNTDYFYRPYLMPFYVLGKVPGLGMSIWAITHPSFSRFEPLVNATASNPAGGTLTQSGALVAETYSAINRAIVPIAEAQGSSRLGYFVSEGGGSGEINVDGTRLSLTADPEAGLLAVKMPNGSLVFVGRNVKIHVHGSSRATIEEGSFSGRAWNGFGASTAVSGPGGDGVVVTLTRATVVRLSYSPSSGGSCKLIRPGILYQGSGSDQLSGNGCTVKCFYQLVFLTDPPGCDIGSRKIHLYTNGQKSGYEPVQRGGDIIEIWNNFTSGPVGGHEVRDALTGASSGVAHCGRVPPNCPLSGSAVP